MIDVPYYLYVDMLQVSIQCRSFPGKIHDYHRIHDLRILGASITEDYISQRFEEPEPDIITPKYIIHYEICPEVKEFLSKFCKEWSRRLK
jgi:hypothetical protein